MLRTAVQGHCQRINISKIDQNTGSDSMMLAYLISSPPLPLIPRYVKITQIKANKNVIAARKARTPNEFAILLVSSLFSLNNLIKQIG